MDNQNANNAPEKQTTTVNVQVPTADNIASRRSLIPVAFTLTIIFFFFSFCDFKCGDATIASVKGIDLVLGTQLQGHDFINGQNNAQYANNTVQDGKIPSNIWAIIAFAAAIVGLGIFLIKEKREALIGTGAGAIGALSLLILQFQIKSALEEKTNGVAQAAFQFPYWGALICLAAGGFISYLRMRKTNNVVVNFVPPPTISPNQAEATAPPQQVQQPPQQIQQQSGLDVVEQVKKNKRTIIGVLAAGIVLYGAYFFFLRHDPERDGKNSVTTYCDCAEQYNEGIIKADQKFIDSFSSYNFKTKQDARNKLQALESPVINANSECSNKAQANYNDLRNRYIANQEELAKFNFAHNAQQGLCNPDNQSKSTSMATDVEAKITTIIDPQPDIEKIKTDLLGKQIPGWTFSELSEFDKTTISNTTQGSDRVEYTIDLHLIEYRSKALYDAQIIVTYNEGGAGWYFGDVKEVYFDWTYNAPLNNWISVTPLSNCTYKIIDNGQRYWVRDGYYGQSYKGGGNDANSPYLTSNQIYLSSREDHPIDLVFKYTPNN